MLFIDNNTSTIQKVINEYFEWSERVDIAVAFLRKSGVNLVNTSMKNLLGSGGRIRIIVGKDFGYTEPDALQYLESLGANIKVFIGQVIYHPKCYIFRKSDRIRAIVGSSNLTCSGLSTGIEWNVALSDKENNLIEISNSFENIWESEHATDLSNNIINEMQKNYEKVSSVESGLLSKFDYEVNKVQFNFEINSSFLSDRYYCPITIPGEYKNTFSKYITSTNRSVTIILPNNKKIAGRIHCSTSSWSRYYQIRSTNKGNKDILSYFNELHKIISIKIEFHDERILVYLA